MSSLDLSCPKGHKLEYKKVKGNPLSDVKDVVPGGLINRVSGYVKQASGVDVSAGNKNCSTCHRKLVIGMCRLSCKPCDFHLCKDCAGISEDGRPVCKHGAKCYNQDPEHRKRYYHPEGTEVKPSTTWRACRYGYQCHSQDPTHLAQFAHPGDRHYRIGLVVFQPGNGPVFETLWHLFSYFDVNESGYLDFEESKGLIQYTAEMPDRGGLEHLVDLWKQVVGKSGFMNFMNFVSWAELVGLGLPVGVDGTSSKEQRPCRFTHKDGSKCECNAFQPTPGQDGMCACGHKASMHRSEKAERMGSMVLEDPTRELVHWDAGEEGLVKVLDENVLMQLQNLLAASHKKTDNWTRDRGCRLHGVNKCGTSCIFANRAPVPVGYQLHRVFRNQNKELWAKYSFCRSAIAEECSRALSGAPYVVQRDIPTSTVNLDVPLQLDSCNEWYTFHGTSFEKCKSICASNFRVDLAGSGCTWKDAGKDKGVPLYGFGIYLAERITKADEYSAQIPEGERYAGMFATLVCRVVGGRTNVVTTNEIDTNKLRTDVFDGPYHSVIGDRVKSLGKPYREVVVYDAHQVFPEFLLIYSRKY